MRHPICTLTLLVSLAVTSATSGQVENPGETRTVHVRLVDGSLSAETVEIDRTYHDTALLFPGDRVEWACDCPPGIEFTIEEPYLLIDLEALEDALTPVNTEMLLDAVREAEQVIPLFGDWKPGHLAGDPWHDASETIVSPAFTPKEVAHGMWKYTWRVRLTGNPDSLVEWDPHIETHPGFSEP